MIPLTLLIGCSSLSKVAHDEQRQASAMAKVTLSGNKKKSDTAKRDSDLAAKSQEEARLIQEVKILLSLPPTEKTIPTADLLLDNTLKLTGAPNVHESQLEQEVQDLLTDGERKEKRIADMNAEVSKVESQLTKDDAQLAKDEVQISKDEDQLRKDTTTLYQSALRIAADDDTKATIFHVMIGAIVFVVLMVCLRVFFTMTKTGAALVAKIP